MRRSAHRALGASVLMGLAACDGRSPSILDRAGTESNKVAGVWWLMFALAAAVYVVVAGLVLVAIGRGRKPAADEGSRADREPNRDHLFIWAGGLAMPLIILSVLGVVTVTTTSGLRQPDNGALRVEVAGKQWWWAISYPGTGVRTASELHVPVGRAVDVSLTSDNVAHSFWVPQLAGKVDVIPGQTNHLIFTATRAGTFRGECAEFCGIQHAHMDLVVVAEPPAEFGRWMARRRSGAGIDPSDEAAAEGAVVFQSNSCAGCHTVRGTSAQGTVGPDLTGFGDRASIAALTLPNTPSNLALWIGDAQHVKPGSLMPDIELTSGERAQIVAYLESLK